MEARRDGAVQVSFCLRKRRLLQICAPARIALGGALAVGGRRARQGGQDQEESSMKGFFVDAGRREIVPINYTYDTMRMWLPGGITIARVFDNGDVLYVDDEAL